MHINELFKITPYEDKYDRISFKKKVEEIINDFLDKKDWRVYENANRSKTYYSLLSHIVQHAIAIYSLDKLPKDYAYGHKTGWWHIHDLGVSGIFIRYCSGLDMQKFLLDGFKQVLPNTATSTPPKHFATVLDHLLNFFTIFSHECYSKDTQILTKEGWKFFYELKDDEVVATFNIYTNKIEFQKIINKVEYDFNGKLIYLEDFEILVTPNHRILYKENNKFFVSYAEQFYKKVKNINNEFLIPYLENMKKIKYVPIKKISKKEYKGKVYCVNVPNQTLIVRRKDDKIIVCMNSAGAVAVSSLDIYSAPYIYKDRFYYAKILNIDPHSKEMNNFMRNYVYQSLQRFVWNLNYPLRAGFEALFTNITLDLSAQKSGLANRNCIWNGSVLDDLKYKDLQDEVNLFNECLLEIKYKGMPDGKPFTFPIITINITDDFDKVLSDRLKDLIYKCSAKYGEFYFQNCINGELALEKINPDDVRSMCLEENEKIIIKKDGIIKYITFKEFNKMLKLKYDSDGWANINENIYVMGLNPETYKIEWTKINKILKLKSNKYVKIKTSDGKYFISTLNHPVAVYTKNGIDIKQAKDINKNDLLLILKDGSSILNSEYQKMSDGKILDEKYAYILGLFTAEGNFLKDSREKRKGILRGLQFTFHKDEVEYIEKVKSFFKEIYNYDVKIHYSKIYNIVSCYIYNINIAKTFYDTGFTKYGRLPNILFNSPKSVINAFLSGFFDGDGYKKGNKIHINDKELAKDLVMLYSLIGVYVTYREGKNSQRIRIQHILGRSSKKGIIKRLRTYDKYPKFILDKNKNQSIWSRFGEFVYEHTIEKFDFINNEFLKLKNGSFAIIRVEDVEINNSKELTFYDIEMEKNHYFVHSLGHITHNCCRLNIDLKEIYRRVGGFFSGGENVGSICVTTLNLPRYGYITRQYFSKDKNNISELLNIFKNILDCCFDVVIKGMLKRKELILKHSTKEYNLAPFIKAYEHPDMPTYFITVGFVGLHECLINLGLKEGLKNPKNIEVGEKIMKMLLDNVKEYQEKYDTLINLEATPSEGAGTRLALIDKKYFYDNKK